MRVLLCADIHGNAEALQAVLSDPADFVICAGDVVHFGPHPRECVRLVRERATVVVRGNHDHGAGHGEDCRAYGPWRDLDEASRHLTDAALSPEDSRYLRGLPFTDTVNLGGVRFAVVHAAPSDFLSRYLPPSTSDDVWRDELQGLDADVLVLGHTHLPMLVSWTRPLVVNPGSVGLPRDGRAGAEYAVWEDGVVTFHRRAYDMRPVVRSLSSLPLPRPVLHRLLGLFEGHGP